MGTNYNSEWGDGSSGQSDYDWSMEPEPIVPQAFEMPAEPPRKRSAAVPILISMICLLSVVVVVGGLVLFLQRDKNKGMDEAAVASSTQSQSSAVLSTVSGTPAGSSTRTSKPAVKKSSGGGTQDTCAALKKDIETKYEGVRVIDKGDKKTFNDVTLDYCDGEWAITTDYDGNESGAYHWTGSNWIVIPGDDGHPYRLWKACYFKDNPIMSYHPSQEALDGMGIEFCEDIPEWREQHSGSDGSSSSSGSSSSGNSSRDSASLGFDDVLACDGSYIYIVASVIVTPGQDAQEMVSQALSQYPGATSGSPGFCGSLRAVDPDTRGDIYPIFYEYGSDLEGACQAYRNDGSVGNVRRLSNQTDEKINECA